MQFFWLRKTAILYLLLVLQEFTKLYEKNIELNLFNVFCRKLRPVIILIYKLKKG